MKFLALFLLTLALILESTITTMPLIFITLLCLTVVLKENWIFFFAFIFGLMLDLVTFKTPGLSSTFFVVFLFLALLYRSKFEIATNYFVLVSSFIGSFIFLLIAGYTNSIILESIISSIIGVVLFKSLQRINANKISN